MINRFKTQTVDNNTLVDVRPMYYREGLLATSRPPSSLHPQLFFQTLTPNLPLSLNSTASFEISSGPEHPKRLCMFGFRLL